MKTDCLPPAARSLEGISRREMMRVGALSCLGLALPDGLRLASAGAANRAAASRAPSADGCILLYMNGGPSHIDTWDPKPGAPAEYRGEFRAISTNVPGIRISEHLPRLARIAEKYAIVRSVTGVEGSHEAARQHMLTGHRAHPGAEYPSIRSVVARERGFGTTAPACVSSRHLRREELSSQPAFNLSGEPDSLQEQYGRSRLGMSCLLARRLIEAGSRFVTISQGGWDTHGQNFRQLREQRLPELDAAFSALLRDLDDRGLLLSTLVVWMGDFGRSPRINRYAGRDHWPLAQSVVFAGGGVHGGQVIGETDETGSAAVERPVTPADLAATILGALGIDTSRRCRIAGGRPVRLTEDGARIEGLFGA